MTTDETARAMKAWYESLPRGKTITPDMAFHAGYEIALAQQNEDVKLYQWILGELEAAQHLLNLLKQGKGSKDDFSKMIDRLMKSKEAANG